MNRIFKVIWSKTKHCYVVVSEYAKANTKAAHTSVRATVAALAAAAVLLAPADYSTAWAADTAIVYTLGDATHTAGNQTIYTKEGTDKQINAANKYTYRKVAAEEEARQKADSEIKEDVAKKADASNVYTKSETDQKFATWDEVKDKADKTDVQDETKAREAADAKIDNRVTTVESKTEAVTYDKDTNTMQVDTRITAAQGLYDGTTKEKGSYIEADKTTGENLNALDTQVKANADAITAEATAREAKDSELNERITNEAKAIHETTNKLQGDLNTESKTREAKDNELNERITNEANAIHDEIKAGDTALNDRITAVKESLQKEAADTYVSKDDASVQDGAVVKAKNKVGQNVQALDTALAKETAARIGADKAQDKVIQQVNKNMADGFNTINTNMANGFNALNAADAAEKKARVEADKKLTEAVNNGLSLNEDNVLQKNTTTIDADGNVTTAKTDANEMIMNKGKDNQITLNEKGIKVGTNSTVMDKDGVYTGGDTYNEAKAAMKSDGSIKGADGKFTVNSATGSVNVNDQINLDGATGTVNAKGLNINNGNMTVNSDGSIATNGGISAKGTLSAADGKFAVDSNGGVKAADGKFTVDSNGAVNAAGGNFKVDSNGGVTAANGKTSIDSNGNITTQGGVTAANGKFSVDSTGKITSTGLDAGNGTIQTTGTVQAGTVKTGTLETTGDATIGGDLTVKGKLNVDEINMTKNGIVGDNNVTASTKVTAGEITGNKKATSTKDGSEKETAFDYDENGTSTWATTTDADKNWKKSTMSVEGSGVTTKAIDSEKNSNLSTQTATQSQNTLTDANKNTNTATQSATESSSILAGKEGLSSTFKQNVAEILNQINKSDTEYAKVDQKVDNITSEVKNGDNSTSTTQTSTDIANTANNGTISNTAKNIENTASENITNTAKNGSITNDAKNLVNKASETLSNEAKNIINTASENMTNSIGKDLTTNVGGNQTTTVKGDSSLTAENINNTAKNKITNNALDVETDATSSIVNKVSNDYGTNTSTQTSSQTKEVMSQKDGKTASYLRGASEAKTQLVNGATKTTIDTIAGQTNTNITDGTNISNNLQKASQIASSVTDGTNTTVANQNATSIASSITDGTNSNNISNTAAQSAQLIKASDTKYSSSTKTAAAFSDVLVSGDSIINILKDADQGLVQSDVSKDGSSTSVKQTSTDITNTAKNGTIANDAKNITNTAEEKISNSAAEIENKATKTIVNRVGDNVSSTMSTEAIVNKAGQTTVTTNDNGTTFENAAKTDKVTFNNEEKSVDTQKTTISGNTVTTGLASMDYAEVMKDLGVHGNAVIDQKLTVKGDSDLQGNATVGKNLTVNGTSDFKGDVTMEANATVKKNLTVEGTTTTDTLHVTSKSTFDGAATFKDIVTMEKDLNVGGNVTASSYKVGDKTYIDANGINANNQKVTNVAAGDVSAASTDAVNGSQLYSTNQRVSTVENRVDGVENRVSSVENRVDKMDSRIDKVGANAAAMANLHPLEFDEDSKWNVAAAVGNYKGETAAAVGAFYRPNEDVMFNLSTTFGNDENMVGGGLSLRLGKGGNREKDKKLKAAIAENNDLRAKVDDLTARMDALLSVINPNMSKEFPDVPENHWAYEAVTRLAGNNIVEGYEDGKFHGERTMTRYEMAEIIYNALSKGAKAEKKLVEEFKPELQAMAAQKQAK